MLISSFATYAPAWVRRGTAVAGPDEDVVTFAVAVGRAVGLGTQDPIRRVVVVTLDPEVLEGFPAAVVARGLGRGPEAWVELRIGGAPAALDAVLTAELGTAVIAVDLPADGPCLAVAALVGSEGFALTRADNVLGSLPMRVKRVSSPGQDVYDDRRVEREMGWIPLLKELVPAEGAELFVAGVPSRDAIRMGAAPLKNAVAVTGAAAGLAVLAELCEGGRTGLLIAVDTATAVAAEIGTGTAPVVREVRPVLDAANMPRVSAGADQTIPLSLPAYERAFEAKVGLLASRCECGAVEFPPRRHCPACQRVDAVTLEPLQRTGEIYTAVTIHTSVPGIAGPYAVAIVSVDGSDVRVLAPVTDALHGEFAIGSRGRLILRRIAWREGVPDYGYAFQPDVTEAAG